MPENIITQTVNFRANGNTADGCLARPESSGPHPAVIVIQEILKRSAVNSLELNLMKPWMIWGKMNWEEKM